MAWDYHLEILSDNDVTFILSNGGYFATDLGEFNIKVTKENLEKLNPYLSEKDRVYFSSKVLEGGSWWFDSTISFSSLEDGKKFNKVLKSLCNEETQFYLVIKATDDKGKERTVRVQEWLFN